jgi:hypothetical protein
MTSFDGPGSRSSFRRPLTWLDRVVGPGANHAEIALQVGAAALGLMFAVVVAPADWPMWKTIVAAFLAFDLAGGVVTTTTRPAKLWYHRTGRGPGAHLGFVAAHILHLVVVALVFRPGFDGAYLGVMASLLMAGAVAIELASERLQRPVAATAWLLALWFDLWLFAPTVGLAWFTPMFFFKLLVGHLLPEEARPGRRVAGGAEASASVNQRPAST